MLYEGCYAVPARLPARVFDAILEIIGGVDSVPDLTARAAALSVADRFVLRGVVLPQDEVLDGIQEASVGVNPNLPSRLNRCALSTKLFEYVAVGIPVVVGDLPTLRSHVTSEEATWFGAGDANELAAARECVADDYESALSRTRAADERYRAGLRLGWAGSPLRAAADPPRLRDATYALTATTRAIAERRLLETRQELADLIAGAASSGDVTSAGTLRRIARRLRLYRLRHPGAVAAAFPDLRAI